MARAFVLTLGQVDQEVDLRDEKQRPRKGMTCMQVILLLLLCALLITS